MESNNFGGKLPRDLILSVVKKVKENPMADLLWGLLCSSKPAVCIQNVCRQEKDFIRKVKSEWPKFQSDSGLEPVKGDAMVYYWISLIYALNPKESSFD